MNSIIIPALIAIIPLIAVAAAAYLYNKEDFALRFSREEAIPMERYQVAKFVIPRPTIDFHARVFDDESHRTFTEGILRIEAETVQFINLGSRFPVWTYGYGNMQARKPAQEVVAYNIELEVDGNKHQMWVGDDTNQAREFLLAIATHGVGPTPRPQVPEASKNIIEPDLQILLNQLSDKKQQEDVEAGEAASAAEIGDLKEIVTEDKIEATKPKTSKFRKTRAPKAEKMPKEEKAPKAEKAPKKEKVPKPPKVKKPAKVKKDSPASVPLLTPIAPEIPDDDEIFEPGEEAVQLGERFDGSWESFKKTAQEIEDEESLAAYQRELKSLEEDEEDITPFLPLTPPDAVEAVEHDGEATLDVSDDEKSTAETRLITEEDLIHLEPHEVEAVLELGPIEIEEVTPENSSFELAKLEGELDSTPETSEPEVEEEPIIPIAPIESYGSKLMVNEPILTIDDFNIDLASFQAARKRADEHMASEVQSVSVPVLEEPAVAEPIIVEQVEDLPIEAKPAESKPVAGKRAARGKQASEVKNTREQLARNKAVAGKRKASKK